MQMSQGRVLIIAGSDSGGGAGIQADIKTVTALGGYATTAITTLTAQNTLGVHGVHEVPPSFVEAQAQAVLDDIGTDVVKVGMLGTADMVRAVRQILQACGAPVVLDPVMIAKGGARLLADEAIALVRRELIPMASLLTPNGPEAEALTGLTVVTPDQARAAGHALLALGAKAVLMKGGHLVGERLTDRLMTADFEITLEAARQQTRHTHGTGCTLASACAVGLAQGMGLVDAVRRAHGYVQGAIAHAPGLGGGSGR